MSQVSQVSHGKVKHSEILLKVENLFSNKGEDNQITTVLKEPELAPLKKATKEKRINRKKTVTTPTPASNKKKDPEPISKIGLFVAEFVGTALLLFLGCMGCVMTVHGMPIPAHFTGITFGLTVMIIVQIFGHISGAHLNPAVTIAAVVMGYLKPVLAPIYFSAQFSGAIFGFGLLKALIPKDYTATEIFDETINATVKIAGLCSTMPHAQISAFQATTIETITTAVLVLICCSIWDKRNALKGDSVGLRFGFAIAAIAMATGPFTGCSMNTARSFAPALLNGDWHAHWIYWVGPTLGTVIGALFYKTLYSIDDNDGDNDDLPLEQCSLRKTDETKA